MHPLITTLNENLGIVAALITSLGTIFGVPVLRRPTLRLLRALAFLVRAPYLIYANQQKAEEREEARDEELKAIKHQLYPNGNSSLYDGVKRLEQGLKEVQDGQKVLEGHRRNSFIMQPAPALELNSQRNALLVSAAFGRLVRADAGGLRGLTYLQYFDGDRVEAFGDAFMDVAQNAIPSEFGGFNTRIYANRDSGPREDRGVWEVRAVPITAVGEGDVLYSATLHPVDDVARAVASRNKWN